MSENGVEIGRDGESDANPVARLALLYVFAAAAMGLAAVAGWGLASLSAVRPHAKPVVFRVESGATLKTIVADLKEQGLVRDALVTEWTARLKGLGTGLRAGEYELSASLTTEQILEHLAAGPVKTYAVVLPEGLTVDEVAGRLSDAGLVDAEAFRRFARDPASATTLGVAGPTLEGYLYPETYRLPRGLTPAEVAGVMVEEFQSVWEQIAPAAAARGMSMRDVVTLASIVEKETGAPEERPIIASVFHNRLERSMRLASDPTVIYGIDGFDGNLRRVHLDDASNPYNTYQNKGLPPGPIANPGADSLRAVVEPAETDYLFFVSRNDGTHVFTRTFREHDRMVDRYQRRRRR